MSLLLRHRPEEIGLRLGPGGWARIDDLVRKGREAARSPLSRRRIHQMVEAQDKPRFSLSKDGERIRANYGHSLDVDLDLRPEAPPEHLYHGTAARTLDTILQEGLESRSRRYVHLSAEPGDAREVGRRHGSPRIVRVQAARLHQDGQAFYRPAAGIWLTEHVASDYLEFADG